MEEMNQNNIADPNQNTDPAAAPEAEGKTFTQEQLNSILQERLAKEKEKHEKELADMQAEIKKREKQLEAKRQLKEAGLSEELIELIKFDNDESFNHSISLLKRAVMKTVYRPRNGDAHDYDDIGEAMGLR